MRATAVGALVLAVLVGPFVAIWTVFGERAFVLTAICVLAGCIALTIAHAIGDFLLDAPEQRRTRHVEADNE